MSNQPEKQGTVPVEGRACIAYAEKDKLEAVTGLGSMTQNLEVCILPLLCLFDSSAHHALRWQ